MKKLLLIGLLGIQSCYAQQDFMVHQQGYLNLNTELTEDKLEYEGYKIILKESLMWKAKNDNEMIQLIFDPETQLVSFEIIYTKVITEDGVNWYSTEEYEDGYDTIEEPGYIE